MEHYYLSSDYQMYTLSYVFEGRVTFKVLHLILLDGLLRLDKELFKTTKPGLSAYASDPRMVIFILYVLQKLLSNSPFRFFSKTQFNENPNRFLEQDFVHVVGRHFIFDFCFHLTK